MPVTLSKKRYVFVCVGCGKLAGTERKDTLTCSAACRVSAHRDGGLRKIREIAATCRTSPGELVQAQAIIALCPELTKGNWRFDDVMAEARTKFDELAFAQASQQVVAPAQMQ